MKNVYDLITSVYFNIILTVIACYFIIMQEVWGGNILPYANLVALGSLASIGFSWCAEVIKKLVYEYMWSWKNVIIGAVTGIVFAVVLAAFV